ncbi:cholesterol oxidase substrate-binding domain-containing protein [Streptomyces sp. NPDC051940]|uniref:cholesterol oxidase substrate-binding domain-containing protein n=1 Tax=Streptomyces sp. NPDC051940 TaxID=3155675 RepID=UPI003414EAFE
MTKRAVPADPADPVANRLTRRALLAGAGAAAAVRLTPAHRIPAGSAAATLAVPPAFPAGIPLAQQTFRNWSREILVEGVWTATARTPQDVVVLADWARAQGWRLRARGTGHTWTPLVADNGEDVSRTLLVDTTTYLTAVTVTGSQVTAQTGALLETVLTRLEAAGLGLAATTAPGEMTVGGILAVGAHGTAVPTATEQPPQGAGFGTLSDLVTRLTAVVWDTAAGRYTLRTFTRSDPDIAAFLVHLGRAFLTEVTLQAAPNQRLRCQNFYDVDASVVFGPPGTTGRTFGSYLTKTGRLEAIWYPFTSVPWLKVWSVAPTKPLLSRQITAPYPYTFANSVSEEQSALLGAIAAGGGANTPDYCNWAMAVVGSGLITTGTWDIWGWSKNTQLYVKPSTLRITEAGWAVQCARADVQRVVADFWSRYRSLVDAYAARGAYPVNCPVELRVTRTDPAAGTSPLLSPARSVGGLDTVVWLDFSTYPGTPGAFPFFREMEEWILAHYAVVRPEWSKGWGYTDAGPWTSLSWAASTVPPTAREVYDRWDPARVFGSELVDALLG